MKATATLVCDVHTSHANLGREVQKILRDCARDVGLAVRTRSRRAAQGENQACVVTLHLPAAMAAAQHPVWCLACRLACFCPDARVSVLVHGEFTTAKTRVTSAKRRTHAA